MIIQNYRRRLLFAMVLLTLFGLPGLAQTAQPAQTAKPAAEYQTTARQQQIDSTIPEDKTVNELLAPFSASVKDKMNVVLGYAPETINKDGAGAGRLGLLITDIIRQQAATKTGRKIDFAIQNNGGLRAEIPAGEITVGTIFRLMPFENELVVVEMSGQDLLSLFESMGVNLRDFPAAVSGAQLRYDQNTKLKSALVADRPLDVNATYTVALTDYLYNGGGEYPILQRGKNPKVLGLLLRDAIIDYVRSEQSAGRKLIAPNEPRILIEDAQNNSAK